MELRSKTQRETVGADAKGLGFMAGEADNRSACDPSPPVLTPVGIRATPMPTDDSSDDTEQYQERADLQHRPGYLTLDPPVRIDPTESVMVQSAASGPLVSLDKQQRSLLEYTNVDTVVSLSAAASVVGTGSVSGASQADVDDEVASYMTLKSPGPFRGPPSRASRRSVSRESVHSVPGDPLVELMSRMVENSQQENLRREQETLRREQEVREENLRCEEEILRREQEARRREQEMERREQEAREDACRREQEARDETKRREQAFEQREKEMRRQNEQREYHLRHQTQIEMENRFLYEKHAAAEKEKEKELIALREKQEVEKQQ